MYSDSPSCLNSHSTKLVTSKKDKTKKIASNPSHMWHVFIYVAFGSPGMEKSVPKRLQVFVPVHIIYTIQRC